MRYKFNKLILYDNNYNNSPVYDFIIKLFKQHVIYTCGVKKCKENILWDEHNNNYCAGT